MSSPTPRVVAIEKQVFGSPSTKGDNFTYLTLIILFNINHLFALSEVATSITI